MKNSLKQLLRTPGKAVLFSFLIAACTLLLVFGTALLVQVNSRINAAANTFKTFATVEQNPLKVKRPNGRDTYIFDEFLPVSVLDFEGANYLTEPEDRCYYIADMPDLQNTRPRFGGAVGFYVMEFTPLEDCEGTASVPAMVEKIHYELTMHAGNFLEPPKEGEITPRVYNARGQTMKAGQRYIALCALGSDTNGEFAYRIYTAPCSTQYAPDGTPMESDILPMVNTVLKQDGKWSYLVPGGNFGVDPSFPIYAQEVTEDFYEEGGLGEVWMNWTAEQKKLMDDYMYVLPTNSLDVLPTYHEGQVFVKEGREISAEEFASGAKVCMLPWRVAVRNRLEIGDKVPLSLVASIHGGAARDQFMTFGMFSTLNAQGKPYEPFLEEEYEIVGTYGLLNERLVYDDEDFINFMFLIPAKSVQASDENNLVHIGPMTAKTTSFQIPNGTIEEFDAALHAAVPEAEQLTITYDDMGYTKVVESLNEARLTAVLFFAVGVFSTAAIIVLLLYFFVVKQKKRTAIERSLGATKGRCRVSILSGLLVLTLLFSAVGSLAGAFLMENGDALTADETEFFLTEDAAEEDEEEIISLFEVNYDTAFSLWALQTEKDVELESASLLWVYLAVPCLLCAVIALLSLLLINRNMKIDPIYLLSSKLE